MGTLPWPVAIMSVEGKQVILGVAKNKGMGTSDSTAFLSLPSPWKLIQFHWPLLWSVHKGEV